MPPTFFIPGLKRTSLAACSLLIFQAFAFGADRMPSPAVGDADGPSLLLADSGTTGYVIVAPDAPSQADQYAVATLSAFLREKTDAVFPVIARDQLTPGMKKIFVGLGAPALVGLGPDPLGSLKDQEYVSRSIGEDIYVFGKGMHGNLHAILDFMEQSLGWRWYSAPLTHGDLSIQASEVGKPVFSVEPTLSLVPFSRQGGFAFKYRMAITTYLLDYNLQNGMNMFLDEPEHIDAKEFSLRVMPFVGHNLFGYIPPSPDHLQSPRGFGWVAKQNYFETNPDFFTMNPAGERVIDQLCFSNPELRKELTKNVLEHLRLLKAQGKERLLLALSAMDNTGAFCHCSDCRALEEKYQTPGGPIFDYLFELCPLVAEQYPGVMMQTLAYRLAQTQKPPVMPEGQKFPDNLVIQFANVQDNTDADWNNPINRPSYEDLLAWRKLTPHLWVWYYASTYADLSRMPNAAVQRLVTDVRLMKQAGVEGVMVEPAMDALAGTNFTQLQRFILTRLLRNVDADVPSLITEFTDYQYGPAAGLVRTYLEELEAAQEKASHGKSLSAGRSLERRMTSRTPALVRQWQGYLDQMEKMVSSDQRCLNNVRRLRRTLDFATLAQWTALTKAYPDYFTDYQVIRDRLGVLLPWDVAAVDDWVMKIQASGAEKPLPPQFDGIDPSRISRFLPIRGSGVPANVKDDDAAFGYAAVVDVPNSPFTLAFAQNDTKKTGPSLSLNPDNIPRGVYRLYELGEIEVTPNCIVWFSGLSNVTQLQVGERLFSPPGPDNDNRYDVFVSMKFDKLVDGYKPSYHTSPRPTQDFSVLCDQIIFVKKPVK